MIHRYVYHNDALLLVDQVRLSPGQAGLLNGWGLFTTLHIFEGIPFAFERHWKRLQKDSRITHCPLPFEEKQVRAKLMELLRKNQVREGSARIYVIYNQIGFWRSEESFPQADLLLTTSGLPTYRVPARLALREHGRHAASPLAGVKVTSWLLNVWNYYEAQEAGFDEVVLLNERGEVAECTAANIFCAKNGRVFTPPLSSGCLEGVTRGILLEVGPAAGVLVEEKILFPGDLYAADEVFVSSTNRTLLPIGEVAGHKVPAAPGPITQKLEMAFSAYIARYIAERAEAMSPH